MPTFHSDLPLYPPLLQLIRVTGTTVPGPSGYSSSSYIGPSLYVSSVQQLRTDTIMPRDREPCLALDANGNGLIPGYYLGRLAGSYQSLPVYEVTCCESASSDIAAPLTVTLTTSETSTATTNAFIVEAESTGVSLPGFGFEEVKRLKDAGGTYREVAMTRYNFDTSSAAADWDVAVNHFAADAAGGMQKYLSTHSHSPGAIVVHLEQPVEFKASADFTAAGSVAMGTINWTGNPTFTGNPNFDGTPVFGAGANLGAGDYTNNPTFTGTVSFTGTLDIKNLVRIRSTSGGGPGGIYGDLDTGIDPTAEFVPPRSDAAAPASAPAKQGLLTVFGIGGTASLWFAETIAGVGGWKRVALAGATGTVTSITLTQPAAGLTITGSGVPITTTGTPTFALANDLAALEGLGSTGIAVRSAADTWVQRTVTGTLNRITVTDGSGVGGNPTVDIAATYVGQNTITTLGTITTGVWTGTVVGPTFGGTGLATYTTGDILYASAANTLAKLAIAANDGRRLIVVSGIPAWVGSRSVHVYHNADQSINDVTLTAVACNSELYDSDGWHDTATNNSRLTCPAGVAGKYFVWFTCTFAANATGARAVYIRVNGTTYRCVMLIPAVGGGTLATSISTGIELDLAVGDYVEAVVYQSSGGALNVQGAGVDYSPRFGLFYTGQ